MKRFVYLCLSLLLLVSLLCACAPKEEPVVPYTAEDARRLLEAGVCDGEMEEVDSYIVSLLYGIPEESITACVSFLSINTSVSADEITALVLTDEAAAQVAEEGCRRRLADQIEACRDYCPEQVPRLEKAVVLRRGNTVLLAAANPQRLPAALTELGLG